MFHSGRNGIGYSLPAGNPDLAWKISMDSIKGPYGQAIVMGNLGTIYHKSQFPDCSWISFSETGEHAGSHYFYYRIDFTLPCFTPCMKSYDEPNTFCLNLDLYSDNSISEVYVNGKPQSSIIGNMPLPNPFNPGITHTQSTVTPVQLCRDWKAGENSLIIEVASSATVAGLLVQAAVNPLAPPDADTIPAIICEGEILHFGETVLTKSGFYFHSFKRPTGCDSNVVLHLTVLPRTGSEINQTICQGQSYEGYTSTGRYIDSFPVPNGCDSVRILNLTVNNPPVPNLGPDQSICAGDSIRISPGTFNDYLWQNGSTSPSFTVSRAGVYAVTVSNSCGSASDDIQITEGSCAIQFPNAFTPNNDGLNDKFGILTNQQPEGYHLQVFNRLGEKVFDTKTVSDRWDGKYKGREQSPGTFSWFCTYRENNSNVGRRGTVVLIR